MKKKVLLLISIVLILSIGICLLCGCNGERSNSKPTTGQTGSDVSGDNNGAGDNNNIGNEDNNTGDNNGDNNSDNNNNNGDNENNGNENNDNQTQNPIIRVVTVTIANNSTVVNFVLNKDDKPLNGSKESYSLSFDLDIGDRITISDNFEKQYTLFNNKNFDGVAKIKGEYKLSLFIYGDEYIMDVNVPQKPIEDTDITNPDNPIETTVNTNITVTYSNSEHFANVYAYCWNYSTKKVKAAWPGEKLQSIGTSEYGEKQYQLKIDCKEYDRIIFNDGNGKQTKDLVLSPATNGYYGYDGTFTNGTDDYGNVTYINLTDNKNLKHLPSKSKKISIYTPPKYTSSKKYGVIYMFDSQNLYIGANGAETNHDGYGSWAVDVAVTSMMKNGNNGVIIVAIDNADQYRDSELTMSQAFGTITSLADNDKFYQGKLDEIGNFIRETVMPYVNKNYSTYATPSKTAIAGSSSGGLAAYYLGLRDNDLYGYIGAFSPANGLFTRKDWKRFYSSKDFSTLKTLIYAYCGQYDNGLEDMLITATKEINDLKSYGYKSNEIKENYVDNATHTENYWRIAFQEFLGWIGM